MKQKPYQLIGSAFLASRKNAILGDEMGLGKTNQAVCAIDLLTLVKPINRTLIVCPAIVRPQWQDQLRSWLLFHNPFPIQQVETTDAKITGKTVIVSYNLINEKKIFNQLMKHMWDIAPWDEFHYLKNVDAKRTMNVLGKDGLVTRCKHNWFLSGTPVTAKPADLFPILVTIARRRLSPYTNWLSYIKQFCDAYKDQYGYWQHHGNSNLGQLSEILNGVMLRRLVKDEEPDLDEPLWCPVKLEMPIGKLQEYEDRCEQIDGRTDFESTQQRSILADLKGGTLCQHIEMVMGSTKKLVVFYHHKAIGRYLREKADCESYLIDGATANKKRHAIVSDFGKKNTGILFAQSQAAGTGLDGLQFGCSDGYFAEMPWNPDLRDQNIRRILRPGQKGKVKAHVPRIVDTVDERIYANWFNKEKVIGKIYGKEHEDARKYFECA